MRRTTGMLLAAVTAAGLIATMLMGSAGPAQAERSRMVNGWFGYWTDPSDVIAMARSSKGVLGEVNIFWWHYAGSSSPICTTATSGGCQGGSDRPWTNDRFDRVLKGLHDLGIDVYATHTDLSYSWARSLSGYLATKKHRRKIARKLTNWVVKSGVDGVDLDWENFAFNDGSGTWDETKPRFVDTMKRLGARLHAQGKKLSVTVPGGYDPFLDNGKPNPGGGYTVYAWSEIAPHVDRLRLMTYDYSWNRPGPIGPHDWTKEAARSAVAQVGRANRHKVYVGVHNYGKAWYVRDSNDDIVTVGDCPASWRPDGSDAIALTPDEARDLANSYGVRPRFDDSSKEWTFTYSKSESGVFEKRSGKRRNRDCTVKKEVWFGAAETAEWRARIVKELGIGGLSVWELSTLQRDWFPGLAPYVGRGRTGAKVKIKVSDFTPSPGATVIVQGKVKPKAAGVKVKRQIKVDGKWRTRQTAMSTARGRVRFEMKTGTDARKYFVRLKSARDSDRTKAVSKRVKLVVAR